MRGPLLLFVLFCCCSCSAQTAVNAYVDFESGNSGDIVTATILANGTHGSVGTWTTEVSLSGAALTYGAITNIPGPVYAGAVSVSGVNYTGTGTRCLAMRHDEFEEAVLTFTSSHAQVCLGYMWSPGFGGALDFNFYDEVAMMGATDYSVNSWEMDGNTSQKVKVHTQAGTSSTAIDLTPVGTTHVNWYWVSQLYDAGNLAKIAIFNATNFAQIGVTASIAQGSGNCLNVQFGEHHGATENGSTTYYDNIAMTFSAADFPLLPTNGLPSIVSRSGSGRAIGRRVR